MNYEPGSICTVNGQRDLLQDKDKGEFMYTKCVIIKRCKSGLLLVAMVDNPKKQNSFAEYNLSPWKEIE
jgi:hypothetical protein